MYRGLLIICALAFGTLLWADPHAHVHTVVCAWLDSPNRMYVWSNPELTRADSTQQWNDETATVLKVYYTMVYMPRATFRMTVPWARLAWVIIQRMYYGDVIALERSHLDAAVKATTAAFFFAFENTLAQQKCPKNQKFIQEMQAYLYE